jgi:hypothetical protein
MASQILSVTRALIREHKIVLRGPLWIFNVFSPKNCHYEKVRFILIWHHIHLLVHSCLVESNHCSIDELVQLLALGVDKQIAWLIGC